VYWLNSGKEFAAPFVKKIKIIFHQISFFKILCTQRKNNEINFGKRGKYKMPAK
jgi:hypothetical protein